MSGDPTVVREALDQWNFVVAAYVVSVGGTLAMIFWSWVSMKKAEARRDEVKRRSRSQGSQS